MRSGGGALAVVRRQPSGDRAQCIAMGLGAARAAVEPRHGDFVKLGQNAGVGLEHAADIELERAERDNQVAAQRIEARHVVGDQRPPQTRVTMGQRTGGSGAQSLAIAFAKAVEDDRFRPFEQSSSSLISV